MPTKKNLLYLHSLLLLSGTVFAWGNVLKEFKIYFAAGGQILQTAGCPVTNPIITPCFWGATAFLIALIWSSYIIQAKSTGQISNEIRLKWFLVASTIFGWGNVALEFYKYYASKMQPIVSCTGVIKSPIYAPCFTGSIIFLASLIFTSIIIKKLK